jgi:hypothetical protein
MTWAIKLLTFKNISENTYAGQVLRSHHAEGLVDPKVRAPFLVNFCQF